MKMFRHIFKINKESNAKIKSVYLSAFREKYGNALKPSLAFAYRFRYFVRGAGAGIAFMLIFFAFSTYADQQNVGPSSILYPLKRSQESVRMALTGAADQPALHLKFAQRRLDEIKEIRVANPESPQIKTLSDELKNEVVSSVATIRESADEFQSSLSNSQQSSTDTHVSNPVAVPGSEGTSNIAPAYPGVATASQGQFTPEHPINSQPKNNENNDNFIKSEDEHKKNDEKRAVICESWSEIIGSNEKSVEDVIFEEPNFVAHLNQKCGGSIQFPQVKVEIKRLGGEDG